MNRKQKQKYALMGQVVTVTKVLREREVKHGINLATWRRDYETLDINPRAGWVVGFRHLATGTTRYYPDDCPVFKRDGSVPAVLVAYWPTRRPVEVPLDGFVLGGTPDLRDLKWTEQARAAAREEAKSFPRRNGRFVKVS